MHWARLNVRIRSKQATTLQLRRPMRRILSTCCARAATDQVTAPPRNVINSRHLIAAPDGTLKGHAAYQPAPVVWKGFRSAACPLWVISGHVQCKTSCPLCANSGHCSGVQSRRPRLRFLQKQGRKLLVSFQEFFDVIFHRDLGMGKRPIMSGSDKSKKR